MSGKYKSRSTGNSCGPSQYITELICRRMADKDKEELPFKFWNRGKWRSIYRQQIIAAHGLLKIYDEEAIIAALLSKKGERIYSLRFKGLDDLIKIEQEKIDKFDKKDIKTIEHKDKMSQPRKPFNFNNSGLRDLDG